MFGLALVVYLIVYSGAGEVANAMLVVGWWLVPITAYHIVPMLFSALSWRQLLPSATRPDVVSITWIRWIRESINSLLPVANIGGDIASARLAHLRGVSGPQAAASMIVDTTVGVVTQMAFVIAGVALLVLRPTGDAAFEVVAGVLIGVGALVAAVTAFVLLQHKNMFARFAKLARNMLPEKWLTHFAGSASDVDDAVVSAYRTGPAFWRANVLRLIGWAAGAGEVWLVTWCLGQSLSAADAFILESLSSGVRAAAFMVPAALGVQEGGLVLFGALFGLPAEIGLVISLSKRVRELLLGLPGLFFWYWIEGHYLLRRNGRGGA
ncbi:MAG TPA: lysylphosphatidylglycerol synthase domain-containing protein [Pseudolabrys sp.]|nr:lysylphosphatidylglycerol synthase domain-containing protein [Pseudolabrys sp.]